MSEWSKQRNYFYRIELLQRHATAPNPYVFFKFVWEKLLTSFHFITSDLFYS